MTHCWLLLGWLVLQNQSWKSTVSPVLSGVLSIWWDGIEGNNGLSLRSSSSAPANHECVGGWFRVRAAFVLSASGWTFCWGRQMVCSCADFSSGHYFYMQSSHPTGEQFVKQNFGDLGDLPHPPAFPQLVYLNHSLYAACLYSQIMVDLFLAFSWLIMEPHLLIVTPRETRNIYFFYSVSFLAKLKSAFL